MVAIQMCALRVARRIALVFTKVLDELPLGLADEDEEDQGAVDRAYWEPPAKEKSVVLEYELLGIIETLDWELELKCDNLGIGLATDDRPNNFAVFRPRR